VIAATAAPARRIGAIFEGFSSMSRNLPVVEELKHRNGPQPSRQLRRETFSRRLTCALKS
jgi:hypothetical protein